MLETRGFAKVMGILMNYSCWLIVYAHSINKLSITSASDINISD